MPESEVAHLKHQIAAEYQAAQNGLTGLASGISRHAFITARMEHMQQCRERLIALVGEHESTKIFVETLERLRGDDECNH